MLSHELPYDQASDTDPNGDGVPLLLDYALDLDPWQNQAGAMPQAVVDAQASSLSIDYYAGRSHISYSVLTSVNLVDWTSSGLSVEPVDGAVAMLRASVSIDSSQRFLRLQVSD